MNTRFFRRLYIHSKLRQLCVNWTVVRILSRVTMADDLAIRRSSANPFVGDENVTRLKHASTVTQRPSYQNTLNPAAFLPASSTCSVEIAFSPVDADRQAAMEVHNIGEYHHFHNILTLSVMLTWFSTGCSGNTSATAGH